MKWKIKLELSNEVQASEMIRSDVEPSLTVTLAQHAMTRDELIRSKCTKQSVIVNRLSGSKLGHRDLRTRNQTTIMRHTGKVYTGMRSTVTAGRTRTTRGCSSKSLDVLIARDTSVGRTVNQIEGATATGGQMSKQLDE